MPKRSSCGQFTTSVGWRLGDLQPPAALALYRGERLVGQEPTDVREGCDVATRDAGLQKGAVEPEGRRPGDRGDFPCSIIRKHRLARGVPEDCQNDQDGIAVVTPRRLYVAGQREVRDMEHREVRKLGSEGAARPLGQTAVKSRRTGHYDDPASVRPQFHREFHQLGHVVGPIDAAYVGRQIRLIDLFSGDPSEQDRDARGQVIPMLQRERQGGGPNGKNGVEDHAREAVFQQIQEMR